MTKNTWFILLIFQGTFSYAQNTMKAPKAMVYLDVMNILYNGAANPISVTVPGYSWNELDITCPDCESFKGKEGRYILYPDKEKEAILFIRSLRQNDSDSLLFTQKFRIKNLPSPIIRINGKFNGDSLDIDVHDRNMRIIPLIQNFDLDAYCKTHEFTIGYLLKRKYHEKTVQGNAIDKETLEILETLPLGAPIFFRSIKITLSDQTVHYLHATFFKK